MKRPLALLVALVCGAAMGLSFAPLGIWPLAPLGVAALFALARADNRLSGAAVTGWVFGAGLFGVTISYLGVLGPWICVLVVIVMALWTAGLGAYFHIIRDLRCWPAWGAAGWTLFEVLSSRLPFGGFGWVRLAYTTADQPLGGWLWILGVGATGFLVAVCGLMIVWMIGSRARMIWGGVAILILMLAGSGLRIWPVPDGGESVTVGIVQGDVQGTAGSHAMGYARSVTDNHLSETITLMAKARTGIVEKPEFIAWPENSTDRDPRYDAMTHQTLEEAVAIAGVPIMVGAVMTEGDEERTTSALWWGTDNTIHARYDKQNAVPFGEFTPMKDLVFSLVPEAKQVGRQTIPGSAPGAIDVATGQRQFTLGPIICYELAFDTVYETAVNGAELIVVQSNNATYTGTFQPRQQFVMTRVRAMEMRREVVVATTSSYSGLIDAKGHVITESREGTNASLSVTVPLRDSVTPALYVSSIAEMIIGVFAAVGVFRGISRRREIRLMEADSDR